MKRYSIILVVNLLIVFNLFSQKEIYFADKSIDSVSISRLHGLQASVNFNVFGLNIPAGIGYFNEIKLGSQTSLILSGNIYGVRAIKSIMSVFDQNGYFVGNDFKYVFDIKGNLQIEPRWYMNYKNRYMNGKNTKLNSGWYLGLPISFDTTPLFTYYQFEINWMTTPSIGYRYAVSNHFFLEGNFNSGISYRNSHVAFVLPFFNFKTAYTFK